VKIALVRALVTATKGGAERYATELVKGLNSLGHDVHVFANLWDQPGEAGVIYHRIAMPRKPAWLRVLFFHWNLRRQLCCRDYDIVLGMTPFWPQNVCWLGDGLYSVWTRIAWPAPTLRWLMCVKRAVMAVNLWLEGRMLSPRTDFFLANSHLVKRQAMCHYGVPEERIAVVYPGVDTTRFNPDVRRRWRDSVRQQLGIGEHDLVFMFASNNFKRKGLDIILRALAAVSNGALPVKLLVVGAGRIGHFRRMAQGWGVSNRTIFVGATSSIEKYYAAADVFVLPTRYDPCAVVCLEAMACGLPVITSRMNGAAELIKEGENGFTLESHRMQQDLQSCMETLRNVELCSEIGEKAKQTAIDFSMSAHLRRMGSCLEEVVTSRQANPRVEVKQLTPEVAINQSFNALLQAHQLTSYEALTDVSKGTEISYNREKRIYTFALAEPTTSRAFFLKRHRTRWSWFRANLARFGIESMTEGMREWHNILAFHHRGLPAVTPIAAGERMLPNRIAESFVITLALDGYMPLDDYLKEHFAQTLDASPRKKKRLLIEAVARLTHDMHWIGFNHRDYYLCHIFVQDTGTGTVNLRIIDLQRVGYRKMPQRRWWIKDLAQLHFSSLDCPMSNWDRLRFFALYARSGNSRWQRRRILRHVLRKSRSIARHDTRKSLGQGNRSIAHFAESGHLIKSASKHDR